MFDTGGSSDRIGPGGRGLVTGLVGKEGKEGKEFSFEESLRLRLEERVRWAEWDLFEGISFGLL